MGDRGRKAEKKKSTNAENNQNCTLCSLMTACLTLAAFLGNSAAQAVAAEDSMKHQSPVILQAVCQPDRTLQQQFKESVTTLGNKNPKKLAKRGISESTAEHGAQLLFCLWYNVMHGMYGRKN